MIERKDHLKFKGLSVSGDRSRIACVSEPRPIFLEAFFQSHQSRPNLPPLLLHELPYHIPHFRTYGAGRNSLRNAVCCSTLMSLYYSHRHGQLGTRHFPRVTLLDGYYGWLLHFSFVPPKSDTFGSPTSNFSPSLSVGLLIPSFLVTSARSGRARPQQRVQPTFLSSISVVSRGDQTHHIARSSQSPRRTKILRIYRQRKHRRCVYFKLILLPVGGLTKPTSNLGSRDWSQYLLDSRHSLTLEIGLAGLHTDPTVPQINTCDVNQGDRHLETRTSCPAVKL